MMDLKVGIFMLLCLTSFVQAETKIRWADAYNDKEELIYREKHTHVFDGSKIKTSLTEYLRPNLTKFAVMESDYSISEVLPVCSFRDERFGSGFALRYLNGEYVIVNSVKGDVEKTLPLSKVTKDLNGLYACQGWHFFLVRNLGNFNKDPMRFRLLIPEQFDYFSVKISKEREALNVVYFRLEFDTWILRLLVPSFQLEYDSNKRDISGFQGVSNILTDDGKTQVVRIKYLEEGPKP